MRLCAFAFFIQPILCIQQHYSSPSPTTLSRTLVNALSDDADYTSVLRLLQRARLIPTLNRFNGSTFFAPTNDAIAHHLPQNQLWTSVLQDESFLITDNIQEKLRQQLFYHLLNYSFTPEPQESRVQALQTLHYPRDDPPPKEPPPNPWFPIPGGLLGGQPQRLRITARGENVWVGVNSVGKGGSKIVKGHVDAGNGILMGIDRVLEPPPDLATVVSQHKEVSYFHKVLTPEITKLLNSTPELTVFLPVDEAWDVLDPYERLYLESEFATDDLYRILNMHAVIDETVKWSDSFDHGANSNCTNSVTTIDGTRLEIVVSPEKTMVSTATLLESDIYAANGVMHLVSSLLIPDGAIQITPEKYLLALKCTTFVSLLHSTDLTSLINDTTTKYTILAPSDDVLNLFDTAEIPEPGTAELKKLLQYHFIPGQWLPKKLDDGMLLSTSLEEPGLGGGQQVLKVAVGTNEKVSTSKSVSFGGVTVIGDPIEVHNTVIYFISRPLTPPDDALQTALPFLDLSSFLAAVSSTSLATKLKKESSTTLLIPHNSAFKRLGSLVSDHLLASSSKHDLENVLLHHTLGGVEYAASLQNGSQHTFPSLEGTDLHFERSKDGSVFVSASGGWTGMKAELYPKDLLTQTGVIHELSDILIPRTVDLTISKLVKAAKGSTMASLVTKAGMDWILNGTAPPEGSPWADQGLEGAGWTLLCPNDDAFKLFNLTEILADLGRLRDIVNQHIVPVLRGQDFASSGPLNNNRPLLMDDSASYTTLQSSSSAYGDIAFRELEDDPGHYVVGIKGARGTDGTADWAKVISWGRSTIGSGMGGVISIDRLLVPYQPGWKELLGPFAVGGLGILGLCGFFYLNCSRFPSPRVGQFRHLQNHVGSVLVFKHPCAVLHSLNWTPWKKMSEVDVESLSSATDSAKSFIAGGFGGVCAVLVGEFQPFPLSEASKAHSNAGHPFDLTKTRLQTAPAGTYKGALDVVKQTLAKDGATGLYRGMVPPLLGVTPIFAISFWFQQAYDMSKKLIFAITPNRKSETLSIGELAAAGFLSAVPTTLVTAPVERAKVLLQVQGQGSSVTKYTGVLDVMRHLYKEGGVRSIFRGSVATLARDGPGSAAYFAAYEVTKKALTPAGSSPSELNLSAVIFAGGTAGVAICKYLPKLEWIDILISSQVLKSRLQSAPTGTYSGIMDCARKTIAQDGVAALWKGFGPAMARAFPANAATFLGVEIQSSPSSGAKRPKKTLRTLSASEIARSLKLFETWSSYEKLETVTYSSIPTELAGAVRRVYDLKEKIPLEWIDKDASEYTLLSRIAPPGFLSFIRAAYDDSPGLFGSDPGNSIQLFAELITVYNVWERLQRMQKSDEKWSEADFVANTPRVQRPICLPQPLLSNRSDLGPESARVLNAKRVIPDAILLIPQSLIKDLSNSSKSAYRTLKSKIKVGSPGKGSSFSFQITPCETIPSSSGFEFISTVFEDKKPHHSVPDDAYRQNRMATTAAVRHLHSLHVFAPVFGITWLGNSVRSHVDWCPSRKSHKLPVVLSARFPGFGHEDSSRFHEWKLERPSGILEVFFLLRNLDDWTVGDFTELVKQGVGDLVTSVKKGQVYRPWRRTGKITATTFAKENVYLSTSAASTPVKGK
ncbi:hypothetical protein C8J56DRAFT_882521 [Mycena floridula]|nr:hypothetical protein C8J56DRAFT_882521 [Mycena floridula]